MILVAYASERGSTSEVADAITATLREEGIAVDLRPAAEVNAVGAYEGVVLGTAIYMGRLHGDARRFLERTRSELAEVPVAVFGMGPRSLEPHDVEQARKQLEHGLARIPELRPIAVEIFGGVVDPAKLRFPLNRIPASDARDWNAIRSWARHVARGLSTRPAHTLAP
jgi:menaquinone-dependent protoporphyrinogen oxidase